MADMMLITRAYNFNIMQHRMAGLWWPGKGMSAEDFGQRLILFRFYHEADLRTMGD
ncbi:hypothetical protein LINPERHAP1_LOCUS23232 [Linum perenne]